MKDRKIYSANFFAMILLILYSVAPVFVLHLLQKIKVPADWNVSVMQVILLLVPTIVYFIITKYPVKETLKLNKIGFKNIMMVITIAFVVQPITVFLSLITQFVFPNRIGQFVSQMNAMPLIVQIIIIALTPAIFEEITMRGVILGGYKNVGIRKAAIMNGLFFAMLHRDGNQALYTFALGVLFVYLVEITGSILSSMICHFTINGSQVIIQSIVNKLSAISGEVDNKIYKQGILSIPHRQLIIIIIFWFVLAAIFFKILMILMKKLIKINKNEQINNRFNCKNHKKVMNWTVYVSLVIYIITIIIEIINVYKWN